MCDLETQRNRKTKLIRGGGFVLSMEIQELFHTNIQLQGLK
jgi:hypothetical protein